MNFQDIGFLGTHAAAAVDPTIYANLSAWWDAANLAYADATPIDNASNKFLDRSSNSNHLIQATAANQPKLKTSIINGKNIVRFDGAASPNNDFLQLTSAFVSAGTDFTVIVVGLVTADSILFGYSVSNEQIRRYRSSAETMSLYDGATDNVSNTLGTAHGSVHMMTWRRHTTALTMRENKTDRTSGTPTSGSTITLDRMGVTSSVFSQLAGDVGEAVIYSVFRTDGECDNLYDNYFKPKWGLP